MPLFFPSDRYNASGVRQNRIVVQVLSVPFVRYEFYFIVLGSTVRMTAAHNPFHYYLF